MASAGVVEGTAAGCGVGGRSRPSVSRGGGGGGGAGGGRGAGARARIRVGLSTADSIVSMRARCAARGWDTLLYRMLVASWHGTPDAGCAPAAGDGRRGGGWRVAHASAPPRACQPLFFSCPRRPRLARCPRVAASQGTCAVAGGAVWRIAMPRVPPLVEGLLHAAERPPQWTVPCNCIVYTHTTAHGRQAREAAVCGGWGGLVRAWLDTEGRHPNRPRRHATAGPPALHRMSDGDARRGAINQRGRRAGSVPFGEGPALAARQAGVAWQQGATRPQTPCISTRAAGGAPCCVVSGGQGSPLQAPLRTLLKRATTWATRRGKN